MVAGTLPEAWASVGAFPALQQLAIDQLPINGTLPSAWANPGAFPALSDLGIGGQAAGVCQLKGDLPALWGSPTAFQQLSTLTLANCSGIEGKLLFSEGRY